MQETKYYKICEVFTFWQPAAICKPHPVLVFPLQEWGRAVSSCDLQTTHFQVRLSPVNPPWHQSRTLCIPKFTFTKPPISCSQVAISPPSAWTSRSGRWRSTGRRWSYRSGIQRDRSDSAPSLPRKYIVKHKTLSPLFFLSGDALFVFISTWNQDRLSVVSFFILGIIWGSSL